MDKKITDWWLVGAIVGVLTPIILFLASKIPLIQVTFSTIDINLREKVTQNLIGPEIANFIKGYIGINLTIPGLIAGAISGIILILAARWIIDFFGTPSDKFHTLMAVIGLGLVIEMIVLSGFSIPAFGIIFGFAVCAIALSFAIRAVYDAMGKSLPN